MWKGTVGVHGSLDEFEINPGSWFAVLAVGWREEFGEAADKAGRYLARAVDPCLIP